MNLGRSVAGSSIIHAATGASALGPNHSYSYTPRAPRLKAPFSSSPRTGKGFGSKKRAHFFERLRASENEKGVRLHGLVTGSRHRSLVGFLRAWDRASKGKRKEMIDEFVDRELIPLEPEFLTKPARSLLPVFEEKRRIVRQMELWAPNHP